MSYWDIERLADEDDGENPQDDLVAGCLLVVLVLFLVICGIAVWACFQ